MANFGGLSLPSEGLGAWTANAATDQIVFNMHASQSANPLSVKNSSGTQLFAISKNGNPIFRNYTTLPTTGLTKGEVLVAFNGTVPKIGIVFSTANGIKLIKSRSKSLATATV